MKRLLAIALLLAALAPALDRGALVITERACNKRLETLFDDPFMLLGMTRGVYLENYGAVLTAEITLGTVPGISPFRQEIPAAEKAALRKKKLDRLPILRQAMKEMLVASAKTLDKLAPNEQLVLAIALLNRPFEDTNGLPGQIIMQADRKSLLAGQTSAIRVREN